MRRIRQEARKAINDVVDDEFWWAIQKEEFFEEVGDIADDLIATGIEQGSRLGLAVDFDGANLDALQLSRRYRNEWWDQLVPHTRDGMRVAIQSHIEQGGSIRNLGKKLEPLFGKGRAQTVAITETTRLYAEGNRIAYANAGITTVRWQTVKDARVDEVCEGLDGDDMTLGQETALPPAHGRCRCWISPMVDGKPVTKQDVLPSDQWTEENYQDQFEQSLGIEIEDSVSLRDARMIHGVLEPMPRVGPINTPGGVGIGPGSQRAMVVPERRALIIRKRGSREVAKLTRSKAGQVAGFYSKADHSITFNASFLPGGRRAREALSRFRAPNFAEEVVAHEYGHAMAQFQHGITRPNKLLGESGREWNLVEMMGEYELSWYSKTAPGEFLAEAIAAARWDPTFAERWPVVAEFVQDVFGIAAL